MARCEKITLPTQIVLLGATGDLAQKKLLSSLMDLYAKGVLPARLHIIAFSKDNLTSEAYREFAGKHVQEDGHPPHDSTLVTSFLATIEYIQGTFDDRPSFERMKTALEAYDASIGMCTSKLFYLAVPPVFYDTIFEQIARTKLDLPCAEGEGWVRILVEKPFGRDLVHAQKLEDKLSVLFREEQIYRIDHYLAKDALQNILAFHFSNVLFEDRWNNETIEAVYIKVFEKFDVSNRGAFFDGVGALRDVGQNHMLQMLALVAMDPPQTLDEKDLRAERAKVLRTLRPHEATELGTTLIKGQYEGYRRTAQVDPTSKTETYFALKTYLTKPSWANIPIYLEHGKALNESVSEILIRFRSATHCICGNTTPHDHPNFVRFSISPEQKITVRFWVHAPGVRYELEPNDLVFDRDRTARDGGIVIANAYEEVLFNAICGDQTLFVSSAEQQAAWTYVTNILEMWQDTEPISYTMGGTGPESALKKEILRHFNI
ncbi:MAG: glucose-6-phosphate dehydrogenase [Candidatus Pacebacteria bacterium]|nr:glucose-6-phosphate dehydrogenase [Candidatus Paceibacterota bacterium]